MVDVGSKAITHRRAVARAVIRMSPDTAARIEAADTPKGDVIGPARIAAILSAKKTSEMIPLCHPVRLTHIDVDTAIDVSAGIVTVTVRAEAHDRTGVEMEAMVAASTAALTVYDMAKGLERGITIERLELIEKTGGRHDWKRESPE